MYEAVIAETFRCRLGSCQQAIHFAAQGIRAPQTMTQSEV
jgi:hypothetical protein